MRLAQADAAIEEQRVEARAGRLLGDPAGAGIGEFIGLADHEGVEGEAGIDRQFRALIHPFLELRAPREAVLPARRGFRPVRPRGAMPADADVHPADRRILVVPQRIQSVAVSAAHPVAQEAGRQQDGDLIAVDAGEGHLSQPIAVFEFADLALHRPRMRAHWVGNCEMSTIACSIVADKSFPMRLLPRRHEPSLHHDGLIAATQTQRLPPL